MASNYHCQKCGSRTGRADGSCPVASCSEYRPRCRKLGFGKQVVERWQKWSSPKTSAATCAVEQPPLLLPPVLEPEPVQEAAVPVLLPERAGRYHCSLLHEVSQPSQPTFEGALRNALKAGGPALAEAVGEARALQMLASIVNLLQYFPQTVLSKVGTGAEVVELFHIALLRVSHALVSSAEPPSSKWVELAQLRCSKDYGERLHRAEATIMGWVGAAK